MVALPSARSQAGEAPVSWLRAIGTIGTILALMILGASMLLRLSTIFGADGQTISTLSHAIENATRLTHRLAASGVGILAVWAVVLWWMRRPLPSTLSKPITWIVTATVVLAVIGPLTPGYRLVGVTIGNVVGGMVLLMAFWWLRESARIHSLARKTVQPVLRAAVFVFLAHIATGAATSVDEMHGSRALVILHLCTALLSTMFIAGSVWDRRHEPALARWCIAAMLLMLAGIALGCALVWLGARPIWLMLVHGMLSPFLAIALVSLAAGDSIESRCPH